MQPIDSSKQSAEITRTESDNKPVNLSITQKDETSSKAINDKLTSAIAEKQRLAIGILLKQTLQNLSNDGLLSVNAQKAILSVKNILPGEFTQLYIQDRVQQHKLAETLATQQLKPTRLSLAAVNQWHSGQLIQSIVYQGTQQGSALLLISKTGQFSPTQLSQLSNKLVNNDLIKHSQVVQIKTDLALQAGQQLLLQVNKNTSELSFELKHSPKESNLISQYINQLVTKQQALPQLLASLKEIASQTNQTSSFFTAQFKNQVDSVLQHFPQLSQLSTGKEVKSALQNSGLYLESKILNSTNITQAAATNTAISVSDLKAALATLLASLKNNEAVLLPKSLTSESSVYKNIAFDGLLKTQPQSSAFFDLPGNVSHAQVQKPVFDASLFQLNNHLLLQSRIIDQLEGVLSRIVVNQLHTREGGEQSFMNFEIPFRHNDQQEVLQLKIREQFKKHEAEQGNKIWTVNMAFELQSLGGIRIYITLDDRDLAMQIWTEEQASQQLFQKYFNLLSERLIDAGFTVSQLSAFHGMPETAENEQHSSQFIIDERV